MSWTTLVSAEKLRAALDSNAPPLVIDCRFELGDPAKGREDYLAARIAGAQYLHLDDDLAGPPSGRNGRHPLPDRAELAAILRAIGLSNGQQVVVYDAAGGAYAARAWWLLRWLGHEAVAVLDGGFPEWQAIDAPVETGNPARPIAGDFAASPSLMASPVGVEDVAANLAKGELLVVDARDPARFRGEPNPMDPVSGHIPGAANRFFRDNLGEDGRFRDAASLRADFAAVLGDRQPGDAVMQCGSGVTACHNLLAMQIAGLEGARLSPGSWSEWIADPERPVETGEGAS